MQAVARDVAEPAMRRKPPKLLRQAKPALPEDVKVPRPACLTLFHEALVAPSGEVVEVRPAHRQDGDSCPEFENPAAKAIKQWKYSPFLVNGRAVPFCVITRTIVDVR